MTRALPASSFSRTDIIALIVACAFFMEGLDGTIIAPAIPEMGRAFGVSAATLSAGISAYLITVAAFIPLSGWAADRFGVRRVFCVALTVFLVASILCALSETFGQFVSARVLQGIGGAMMSPVGRMEVLRKTPKERFLRAMAMVTWPGLTAFIVGPPLGGFITTYFSWRWIFFINIPIGLVGIGLVLWFFGNERGAKRPFDWRGFLLNGATLASLMFGLETVAHAEGGTARGSVLIAAGLVLGVIAVRHALGHAHPLVSLRPLRHATFAVGSATGGAIFRMTIGAVGFLFPTMFQIGFGMTAFDAGLFMLVFAAGDLAMKLRATYLVRRFGMRPTLIVNGLLIVCSTLTMLLINAQTPFWAIVVIMWIGGMVRSQQFTSTSAMTFADIPPGEIANATTLANMIQQISFGLGVAFGAIFLVVAHSFMSPDAAAFTPTDFRAVFVVLAAIMLASIVFYVRLDPHAGASVSGRGATRDADPATRSTAEQEQAGAKGNDVV